MSKIIRVLFNISVFMTLPAFADDVDDVKARAEFWAESISKADPDLMASLYHDNAILHGTGSPVLRLGTDLIREYFAGNGPNPPSMFFIEPMHIRIFDDIAVNTGNYAAQFGNNDPIVLRYSFVYQKIDNQWMIIDHHSSRLPN